MRRITLILLSIVSLLLMTANPLHAQQQDILLLQRPSAQGNAFVNPVSTMLKGQELDQVLKRFNGRLPLPSSKKVTTPRKQPLMSPASGAILRGSIMFNSDWEDPHAGLYDITSVSSTPVAYFIDDEGVMIADMGGAIIDGIYYIVYQYDMQGFGTLYIKYAYDFNNGEWLIDQSGIISEAEKLAWSNTPYDAQTGLCYGTYFNSGGNGLEFASMDYVNNVRTFIKQTVNTFVAFAIDDRDGQLYGISLEGKLYKIDKATGDEELVGDTGYIPYGTHQAAVIDSKQNTLYWVSVNSNQTSSLYAINLSTALATKCYDFDGTMQFADLYLISSGANEKAPAPVTNLYAKPYASDYSRLQVSFTMPTTTNDGLDNLSGNLTYNIKIDGDIKKTGTAQPGANVSELINGLELGRTVVAVFASNNEGESVEMSVDAWVGLDLPSAPTDVVLTASGNRMTLNWTAPTDGEHGGYLDNATLAYNIVRYPDNAVVATGLKSTSFTEVLSVSQLTVVNYGVVAVTKDGESAETMSNNISIGESITPPYHEPFDTETALDYYTILDNNNDTYSWRWYDGTMECPYMGTTMDDWLLTPPIKLETGKEYTFSFDTWVAQYNRPERIEVAMGQGDNPASFSKLLDVTPITNENPSTFIFKVRVNANGDYRFGIHDVTTRGLYLYVDNVTITHGADFNSPAAVENLAVTPDDEGVKAATITFKAPTRTVNNTSLSSISKIEISRNGELVHTIDNPATGSEHSYYDNTVPSSGIFNYEVAAYNNYGKGELALAEQYIGEDYPTAPVNTSATDNGDGTVTINWQNTSIGQHEGWVNTATIINNIYEFTPPSQVGARLAQVTSSTTTSLSANLEGDPGYLYFAVKAQSPNDTERKFESEPAIVRMIKGTSATLPFFESFANKNVTASRFWWGTPITGTTNWAFSSRSWDNDGGSIGFTSGAVGDDAIIATRKITLSGAEKPSLTFYYYANVGQGITLNIEIDRAQKNGIDRIASYDMSTLSGSSGWRREVISLADYVGEDYIIVRFRAVAKRSSQSVFVDNVNILDAPSENMSIEVSATPSIELNGTANINVTVTNHGNLTSGNYKINVTSSYADALNESATKEVSIAEIEGSDLENYGGTKSYELTFTSTPFVGSDVNIHAELVYSDADISDNNADATIIINRIDAPVINDLVATNDDMDQYATLSWTKPSGTIVAGELFEEDFESYNPWSLDFGNWISDDVDGGLCGALFSGVTYPNQGSPFGFIMFNPSSLGSFSDNRLVTHSGSQCAAAIYSLSSDNVFIDQDNWLISPELTGKAQTVSFFAKSFDTNFDESFEILYSSTDNNLSSFIKLGNTYIVNKPTQWEEITVDLPDGARYFAIRHISDSDHAYVLMIDDVKFMGLSDEDYEITAFNIYVDGELFETISADQTTHDVGPLPEGEHKFHVTSVYGNKYESGLSNEASTITAIYEVISEADLANANVSVYTTSGKLIAKGVGVVNSLPQGIYIVKLGNSTIAKTLLKK